MKTRHVRLLYWAAFRFVCLCTQDEALRKDCTKCFLLDTLTSLTSSIQRLAVVRFIHLGVYGRALEQELLRCLLLAASFG